MKKVRVTCNSFKKKIEARYFIDVLYEENLYVCVFEVCIEKYHITSSFANTKIDDTHINFFSTRCRIT